MQNSVSDKNKNHDISSIIDELTQLNNSILNNRIQPLGNFILSTINGDIPTYHLVLNANLGDNNKGIIVYILTDLRLIKFDIDAKEIKSNSFPLNTLIGIERSLIEDGREQFNITFQNGSFGLRYPQNDQKITNFFQKIDQRR